MRKMSFRKSLGKEDVLLRRKMMELAGGRKVLQNIKQKCTKIRVFPSN
jgi:hypothetical protein